MCQLNIFRPPFGAEPENDDQQRTNILSTRVYLISLLIILIAFTIAAVSREEIVSISIENPTQIQFKSLSNATCPCSHISLSYGKFVSAEPSFHQVCSSDFVSDQWISSLYHGINTTYFLPTDIRSTGFALFQAIASFCRLSQENVNQSLSIFGSSSFTSTFAVSEFVLRSQIESLTKQFQLKAPSILQTQIQLINTMNMRNKMMNGLSSGVYLTKDANQVATVLNIYVQDDESWCTCLEIFNCTGPLGIYDEFDIETMGINDHVAKIKIPGLRSGCLPVDACLRSSLECFFNQTCVDGLIPYLAAPYANFTAMTWQPSSRFYVNYTMDSIVAQLMVEEWGFNVSYNKYYAECLPLSCTYQITGRHNFLSLLTTIISLLGGLCTGLRIVVPFVIRFIRHLFKPRAREPITRIPCKYLLKNLCRPNTHSVFPHLI